MEPEAFVRQNITSTVDDEVQKSISNLVSALGGPDPAAKGYKLGDEALACLRDLRKWLQNYDAKFDRLEISCAIANTTLVTHDIPSILSQWDAKMRMKNDPYLDRIALACLEILVPLTWPIEIVGKEATAEHFSQSMYLRKVQLKYKSALINHPARNVLKAVIHLAAKSALKADIKSREERDEGVLTLVCSLFRNLVAIESEGGSDRGTLIHEFQHQKVLGLLLTVASGLGANFDTQDTLILETVYHIVRSIDIPRLYGIEPTENSSTTLNKNLKALLDIENEMNSTAFKPSRHSRFGTMVSMSEGDGVQVTMSGQKAVARIETSLAHINSNKKWHKPRLQEVKDEVEKSSFMPSGQIINGDHNALKTVKAFANDFLDSSFNPMFAKVRTLIEKQQSARVNKRTAIIYCYLTGWFLEAERIRARSLNRLMDFQLVGEALGKKSFGILMGLLRRGLEPGDYRSTDLVHAAMLGLRQVLLTVRDMSYSGDQDLMDIADGMKSRLFYEEEWLNMLAQLPRTSHRKSLAYACETVALTHVALKMLEEYAKQHTYLFVKSKRARQKQNQHSNLNHTEDHDISDIDYERDQREAIRVTNERKFSFDKFVLRYIHEATITTYERVLSSFRDVSKETIMQVFSFFRRTFVKTNNKAVFYRMSLMRILLALVGNHGLPEDSETHKVAEQFIRYFVSKFVATADKMPSLHVQVNEIMTPQDAFYYDHSGHDKERYKPPKYEFSLTNSALKKFEPERQMAVLVAALIDNGKGAWLNWIEEYLNQIIEKNRDSSVVERHIVPTDQEKLKTIRSDALLRLLLRYMGLIVNVSQGQIVLPGDIDKLSLIDKLMWLHKYQNETVEFPNGKTAMDFIKIEGDPDPVVYESDDDDDGQQQEGDPSLLEPRLATTYKKKSTYRRNNIGAKGDSSSALESSERNGSPNNTSPIEMTYTFESSQPLDIQLSQSSQETNSHESNKRVYSDTFEISNAETGHGVREPLVGIRKRKAISDEEEEEEDF